MTDRERIEYLMNIYNLTPSQFADKTGIQRASVSHILADRNKPSLEVFLKIHRAYPDVSLAWLVADEGEPPVDVVASSDGEDSVAEDVVGVSGSSAVPHVAATTLFPSFMEDLPVADAADTQKTEGQSAEIESKQPQISPEPIRNVQQEESVCTENVSPKEVQVDEQLSLRIEPQCNKRIREIKVFYDNGTYETFLPER